VPFGLVVHRAVVLSIGKLAVGQERYYEKQVAQGLDDYFTGRGESPGRWLGRGASDLGLYGTVEDGELSMLMQGRDPRSGTMLREQPVKVAALDLTFSAPKSISVLHAVANERIASELVACHEQAVEAAVAYLEDTAGLVTRRAGDRLTLHPGGGFVTAAFRHRMSRALDPQLHTHCVSANLAKGKDGRWTALHHPTLYRAAQTAGYLYQAHIRALVRERLGLEWGQVRKGAAELDAIEPEVLDEFSKRRHEMRRAAEDGGIGLGSKSASQAAALATRARKQYGVDTGSWRDEVRARAAEHGLDRAELQRMEHAMERTLERGSQPEPREDVKAQRLLGDRLAGAAGLTELQNTFDQRAVLRAFAEDAQQGARIRALIERGDRFGERQDVLLTERGELTTAELVAVERRLIAAAQGRAGEGIARINPQAVSVALGQCGRALNDGQRKAVEATVASGHGVQVIEALAGTGKTYTAGVLRYVYQHAGYEVVGVAPTGRAVRELTEVAGLPSRTLDSLLASLECGYALPAGGVVVLDEAGMAPTRQTAALLEAAQEAACKVVAIGDAGQLHSVQAGGWMRAVGHQVVTLRLSEVLRQGDPIECRVLASLHDGAPGRWLEWAKDHGRVELDASAPLLDRAVSEWATTAGEVGIAGAVLIARDNDTRRALNDRARALVRDRGVLGEERSYGTVRIAVGDRVICRRNDREVDVDNGTRGVVQGTVEQGIAIETDAGKVRYLPAAYVAEHVEHAYALTGHGMQGGTVECAFVVAAPHELTKGWSYTALSRARGQTRLFVIIDHEQRERDELAPGERHEQPTEKQLYARIARYMQTRDDEDLALEQLPKGSSARQRNDIDNQCVGTGGQLQQATAEQTETQVPVISTLTAYHRLRDWSGALEARLNALKTPEVARLEGAERRELHLIEHQDELIARARRIPVPPRLRLATDRHAAERANLEHAIDGVRTELAGVRTLRDRLVEEIGKPHEIRAQRAALEHSVAQTRANRDALLSELIARELASDPQWTRQALGRRPSQHRQRELWDRAARGLARYRLEQGIDDERQALGERPGEPAAAARYEAARSTLERVQRELGPAHWSREIEEPIGVPGHYLGLLGDARAARLQAGLATEVDRLRGLPDDQLATLAREEQGALARLDRQAAYQALRLEREVGVHKDATQRQSERAEQLEQHASGLGWRARRERDQLRRDAALQHEHSARHRADADRLELELMRLRAAGRHPDQWLDQNAERLSIGIVASTELAGRREREVARQVELAVTEPPAHVIDLIGERPQSGVRLAQEWERLTGRLVRHRLDYGVDVDRDGPLGPDPSRIPIAHRSQYAVQREELTAHISEYRQVVKLPVCELTHEHHRDDVLERTL
jgi:conjugative relaxase-like TrwC/TraI family protein